MFDERQLAGRVALPGAVFLGSGDAATVRVLTDTVRRRMTVTIRTPRTVVKIRPSPVQVVAVNPGFGLDPTRVPNRCVRRRHIHPRIAPIVIPSSHNPS